MQRPEVQTSSVPFKENGEGHWGWIQVDQDGWDTKGGQRNRALQAMERRSGCLLWALGSDRRVSSRRVSDTSFASFWVAV